VASFPASPPPGPAVPMLSVVREFDRLREPPSANDIDDSERSFYDAVMERTGRVHGAEGQAAKAFGALLNSPPLAAALTEYGTQVRRGQLRGTYTDAQRELIDISLAADLASNAILPIHIADALAVGVRPEAVEALLHHHEEDLNDEERELVAYARHFVAGDVTDEVYSSLEQRLGRRGAVEFTVVVAFLLMTIRLWQALGVPEPSDEEVDALLLELLSGQTTLPDPNARIG
jgi:alkylhydroperoxidase family enzyme